MAEKSTCPICDTRLDPDEEYEYRPFCSKRCKREDLSRWFNEEYAIPLDSDRTERDISSAGSSEDGENGE